jgi:hypothetical protein
MNQDTLGIKDEQFWEDATRFEEALVERYWETDFMGLLLDGPKVVRLHEHDTLPLLGVRSSTIHENRALSLQRRAVIVTTRLEGHETLAAMAFRQPDEPRRHKRPRDPDALPKGRTVKVFSVSLNERLLGFPWKRGAWQTTILLYDRCSNSVTTRLEEYSSQDPEVLAFLAAQRRPGYPPPISRLLDTNSSKNPSQPARDLPLLAAEVAIVLTSERVAIQGPGKPWMLHGSFCLPVLPRDVVRPLPEPPDSEEVQLALSDGWVDVGDPKAVAVMPITLLLTGNKNASPILISLHVPVYVPLESGSAGQVARGQFTINLFGSVPNPLAIQSYAVWAISRGIASDPVLVDILATEGA